MAEVNTNIVFRAGKISPMGWKNDSIYNTIELACSFRVSWGVLYSMYAN